MEWRKHTHKKKFNVEVVTNRWGVEPEDLWGNWGSLHKEYKCLNNKYSRLRTERNLFQTLSVLLEKLHLDEDLTLLSLFSH